MAATSINCLAVVLKELGWSYTRLIAELRRHASVALPKTESMVTLVSRWVNNHQQPDDFYRDLLSKATGRARAELFSDEPAEAVNLYEVSASENYWAASCVVSGWLIQALVGRAGGWGGLRTNRSGWAA